MICFDGLESRLLLSASVPQFSHIVVLLEENHAAEEIYGNPDAPFFNMLASGGAQFTQSYALSHPSEPNYLALFSGSTHGVTDDGSYSFSGQNLASELSAAGLSFVGYAQSPSVIEHDPWQSFTNSASDSEPMSDFPSDFSQLPAVSFVVPNLNNDMHNGTVAQADAWAQKNLAAYAQWTKSNNSLLIVEWDEDDGTENNNIPTFIYGADVVPGQYSETINDYSLLRTMEDAFGLSPLGQSAKASPITDIFQSSSATNSVPSVADFEIDGGSVTSKVESVTLQFNEPVTIADSAITLTRISPKTRAISTLTFTLSGSDDDQTWTLTFTGSKKTSDALPAGVYVLGLNGSDVTDSQGQPLTGGTQVFGFSSIHQTVSGDGTSAPERYGQNEKKDGFRKFVKNYENQLTTASSIVAPTPEPIADLV